MNSRRKSDRRKAPRPHSRPGRERMLLRLYVTGASARSFRAITNIRRICEKYFDGLYDLEVIDIYQRPKLAKADQIIATPTLIKTRPHPHKCWIGDLTNTDLILSGLNLLPTASAKHEK